MEVYMFQKTAEYINDCEYETTEELFYKKEDAIEYSKLMIEEEIQYIEKMYCDEGETVETYCEITELCNGGTNIYMEDEFWISFNVYKKKIMSF